MGDVIDFRAWRKKQEDGGSALATPAEQQPLPPENKVLELFLLEPWGIKYLEGEKVDIYFQQIAGPKNPQGINLTVDKCCYDAGTYSQLVAKKKRVWAYRVFDGGGSEDPNSLKLINGGGYKTGKEPLIARIMTP